MLAVDDALHAVPAADDKWPEVVIVVVLYGRTGVALSINVEKRRGQVGDELLNVLLFPTEFALKIIDRVFPFVQHIENGAIIGVDFVVVFAHTVWKLRFNGFDCAVSVRRSGSGVNSVLLVMIGGLKVSGKAGTPCCSPVRHGKNVGNEEIQSNSTFPACEISGGV